MHKHRLLWQLFPSYLVITLIALLALGLYAARSIHAFYLNEQAKDLQTRVQLLGGQIEPKLAARQYAAVDAWSKQIGRQIATRITVILPSGQVVADSDDDPSKMDNHGDRPEVVAVLHGADGQAVRYSYTLHREMLYVAGTLTGEGKVLAVLRVAVPATSIAEALNALYGRIALAGLIVALLAAAVSMVISRWISRPLEEMNRGADRFAQGELAWRLDIPRTQELAVLAEGLNSMARQLDDRIRSLERQRNEQEAVLASMVEGVLAVDSDERIISINTAGARLLQVGGAEVLGRTIQEVVRNPDLQAFVRQALSSDQPVEGDIVLHDHGGRFLQAHGAVLHDGQGQGIGAVIVLNDVTRLHRLETVRRDFVANVSHELKTPITSIKGFVETLLDGALKDPDDARRFLEIVARQTDRLNAIIEDILTLSRVEDQAEKARIQLEKSRVLDVVKSAVQLCELQARAKDIAVQIDCDEALMARVNAPLLEQALVNLVDNAIKYSDPGKEVGIEVRATDSEVVLRVRDRGCGIERTHVPRIFERFYRVDKARSRKLGGTGLGLAIVKHIALAHGGTVEVESTPGQGSTFSIRLPTA